MTVKQLLVIERKLSMKLLIISFSIIVLFCQIISSCPILGKLKFALEVNNFLQNSSLHFNRNFNLTSVENDGSFKSVQLEVKHFLWRLQLSPCSTCSLGNPREVINFKIYPKHFSIDGTWKSKGQDGYIYQGDFHLGLLDRTNVFKIGVIAIYERSTKALTLDTNMQVGWKLNFKNTRTSSNCPFGKEEECLRTEKDVLNYVKQSLPYRIEDEVKSFLETRKDKLESLLLMI